MQAAEKVDSFGLRCSQGRPWILVILVSVLFLGVPFSSAAQDVLTYHNDNARDGLDTQETILTPANVNSASFGLLFTVSVDGKVDAQPLVVSNLAVGGGVHNALFVATEHDSVYAFDADTGAALWHVSLLGPGETPSDPRNCGQVAPEIGITATPVIDRSSGPHGTIYAVAMSKDSSGNYHQRLHALDLTTGQEEFSGPVEIQASYPGTGDESQNGTEVFDPKQHKERAGLLLLNHDVYTFWSSHCDIRPYTGWVIGYAETTLAQTSVLNLAPNGNGNSIWQSDTAPAADSTGNIYAMLANGSFDTALTAQGLPSHGDYGNAFVKLSPAPSSLSVADYFTMSNTTEESAADEDLGSGGVLLLPDLTDATGVVHQLAVGAGKDQVIYVIDRNNMGKFSPSSDNTYQELPSSLNGSEFGMPAYFNNTVYFGASGDNLSAFPIAGAKLQASPSSTSSATFGYPGTTPSISANGTSNAIVWAAENSDPAALHAYDATGLSRELYNSNQAAGGRDHFGTGNKFITPTVANGKVYVGTTSGVGVFGLLLASPLLSPANLAFSGQVVGTSSAVETATFTNGSSSALTIAGISSSGDFTQTNTCGSSLAAASSCTINVTFTPSAGGNRSGSVTVKYGASGVAQSVALSGVGEDFSIAAPQGSSTSATVSPGQAATYNLSVASAGGFSQTVALACTGAPPEALCSVSPASIALTGTSASAVVVTVTTAAPSLAGPFRGGPRPGSRTPWRLLLSLSAALAALYALGWHKRLRPKLTALVLAAVVLSLVALNSCGGGSSGSAARGDPGTPAGTYNLTVTGSYTSGSTTLTRSAPLQLTVQ